MPETETLVETVPAITIALNDDIALDLTTLIETRLLVQANSGGGKSFALRRLLEQSHGKVQHLVIDVEGTFRTLRERLEYLLLGAESDEVDYPLTTENAAQLATTLLEMRTSAILDLYEFLPSQRAPKARRTHRYPAPSGPCLSRRVAGWQNPRGWRGDGSKI